ncbi:MAG: hypothetical protein HQ483_00285 [Rhodospirillales bacterium]|nr:hypothetical protein [Rhodospirillales bacterium]
MTDKFENYPFKEFRTYLKNLRTDSGRIQYDDINLMDVYGIAPWIYVLDVGYESSIATFTFRFVGTGMCTRLGFDPTGKRINDLASERVYNAYCNIINTGRPHVLSMIRSVDSAENFSYKKAQTNCLIRLAYPTFSSNNKIDKIIGVGQFISLDDPETDQSYEFVRD